MRLEQMSGYSFPTMAVWPKPLYENHLWQMYELKLTEEGALKWFRGYCESDEGHLKADIYGTYELAVKVAEERNQELSKTFTDINFHRGNKESLLLKVEKEITRQSRLLGEEQLMLSEAKRRHQQTERPSADELILPPNCEHIREQLIEILNETPYIGFVRLSKYGVSLLKENGNDWSTKAKHTKQSAKYFYRERIAAGFGLSGLEHWGKTKSSIRDILLPKANKLLELASVKRMLAEAELQGQRVVVASGFVFWFEENDNVGWTVKKVSYSGADKSGNTLWKKGTILSKNHGRIVVLPYVKENGELVQGHTKNASHDGAAKPRHPKEYVELPYEVLKDDLMIGLFGQLKYQ